MPRNTISSQKAGSIVTVSNNGTSCKGKATDGRVKPTRSIRSYSQLVNGAIKNNKAIVATHPNSVKTKLGGTSSAQNLHTFAFFAVQYITAEHPIATLDNAKNTHHHGEEFPTADCALPSIKLAARYNNAVLAKARKASFLSGINCLVICYLVVALTSNSYVYVAPLDEIVARIHFHHGIESQLRRVVVFRQVCKYYFLDVTAD